MDDAFSRQRNFFSSILSGKKPTEPEEKEYEIWEDTLAGMNTLEDMARWTGVKLARVKELASEMQQAWEEEEEMKPTLIRIRAMKKLAETPEENYIIGWLYGLAIGRYHSMQREGMRRMAEKLKSVLGDGTHPIVADSAEDAIRKLKAILQGIQEEDKKGE